MGAGRVRCKSLTQPTSVPPCSARTMREKNPTCLPQASGPERHAAALRARRDPRKEAHEYQQRHILPPSQVRNQFLLVGAGRDAAPLCASRDDGAVSGYDDAAHSRHPPRGCVSALPGPGVAVRQLVGRPARVGAQLLCGCRLPLQLCVQGRRLDGTPSHPGQDVDRAEEPLHSQPSHTLRDHGMRSDCCTRHIGDHLYLPACRGGRAGQTRGARKQGTPPTLRPQRRGSRRARHRRRRVPPVFEPCVGQRSGPDAHRQDEAARDATPCQDLPRRGRPDRRQGRRVCGRVGRHAHLCVGRILHVAQLFARAPARGGDEEADVFAGGVRGEEGRPHT
mmetsp:Transcript_12124/g.31433  ORF Transcript_12124/g.31433 Transcript_12124/m.31433 type:complete len:336 (-) Transcript_12124:1258-2265(-)